MTFFARVTNAGDTAGRFAVKRTDTDHGLAVRYFQGVTATEITYSNQLDEPDTRRKLKTEARPTPAPKPAPLELNGTGTRTRVENKRTTRTTSGK